MLCKLSTNPAPPPPILLPPPLLLSSYPPLPLPPSSFQCKRSQLQVWGGRHRSSSPLEIHYLSFLFDLLGIENNGNAGHGDQGCHTQVSHHAERIENTAMVMMIKVVTQVTRHTERIENTTMVMVIKVVTQGLTSHRTN